MKEIGQIKKISIWIFVIPVVVINLCLFIAINGHLLQSTIFQVDAIGRTTFTLPYIDGGVSISRIVRTYPAYLLFKPAMLITAILLIQYWVINNRLFKKINNDTNKNNLFLKFGVGSALFLILHSIFLGINFEIDIYKFFRRFVLLAFIIFEIVAQSLLVYRFFKLKTTIINHINNYVLILKIILVSILVAVAITSLPIVVTSGNVHFKHALEWNYFIGVILFYMLTFLFWKKN